MTSVAKALRPLPSQLVFVAVVLLFFAERVFAPGDLRMPILAVAGFAFIGGVTLRVVLQRGAPAPARRLNLATLACYAGIGVGGGLYFAHLGVEAGGRLAVLAEVASLMVLFVHLATLFALELVSARMREAGFVEMLRVRQAAATALSVAFALGGLVLLSFAVNRKDARVDFSYGAPTTPSEATRSLLEASPREVEVYLFFERGSPVLTEVGDYFDALGGGQVKTRVLDQALDPALAKALKVSRNGTIAFKSGERSQTYFLGADAEQARRKLPKLDEEVRERLSKLTRDEKIIYFTSGHGEREVKRARDGDRVGAARFKELVEALNTKVKRLGLAEGLGSSVPDDADLVVVHGPTSPFLPAEATTLKAYLERGGALWLLLDPAVEHGLDPILEALGLALRSNPVANDKEFVRLTHTNADHAFVFSTSFASHRSVKALNDARGRAALLLLEAGVLDRVPAKDGTPKPKVTIVARSRAGTFEDADRDYTYDEGQETRGVLDFGAAVEVPREGGVEARALVLTDSDALADQLLQNDANAAYGYEGLLWLLRDELTSGAVPASDDVPIRHTREEDSLWFYGTTFAAPLLVVVLGLTFIRVKRKRRRA